MRLILLAVFFWLLPVSASATWLKAETRGFVAYARGSEDKLRERVIELQRFEALARKLTGIAIADDTPPLTVYFVTARDLNRLAGFGSSVAGFYLASNGGIYTALATDTAGTQRNVLTTLFHEYSHHFMFQNTRAAYPAWYVEGFAEYLSTAKFGPDFMEFGQADGGRGYQLSNGDWLHARNLMTKSVRQLDYYAVFQFYAEAWLAVHYFSREPTRLAALNRYLAALGRGEKAEPAFKTAFGFDFDELDRRLRRYVRSDENTMTRIKLPPAATRPVTITRLPASADALVIPAARLAVTDFRPLRAPPPEAGDDARKTAAKAKALEVERRRRADLLATVRQAAGRLPGDLTVDSLRAEAEIKLGDRALGIKLLDAALARAPSDAQLLYLRGRSELAGIDALPVEQKPAAYKRARVWLTRANAARPDDFRILFAHVRSFDGVLPEHAFDVLLRAAELAPQVASIQATTALVLARRGERGAAKQRLGPIAAAPHGGASATAAAALIEAIDKGQIPEKLPSELDE